MRQTLPRSLKFPSEGSIVDRRQHAKSLGVNERNGDISPIERRIVSLLRLQGPGEPHEILWSHANEAMTWALDVGYKEE